MAMNPRLGRALLVALVLTIGTAALYGMGVLTPGAATTADPAMDLDRRSLLIGMLTLGVLGLAAYGFDLRDWF